MGLDYGMVASGKFSYKPCGVSSFPSLTDGPYRRYAHRVFLIRQYTTSSGINVFRSWLESLPDRRARAHIAARLERLTAGNFGDCKPIGGGVSELRIDHGPVIASILR